MTLTASQSVKEPGRAFPSPRSTVADLVCSKHLHSPTPSGTHLSVRDRCPSEGENSPAGEGMGGERARGPRMQLLCLGAWAGLPQRSQCAQTLTLCELGLVWGQLFSRPDIVSG